MTSQKQIIINLLEEKEWTCTSEMYAKYMADPRKRLHEIKQMGYVLEAKKCELHNFHLGGSKMWRLVAEPTIPLPEAKNALDVDNVAKIDKTPLRASFPLKSGIFSGASSVDNSSLQTQLT